MLRFKGVYSSHYSAHNEYKLLKIRAKFGEFWDQMLHGLNSLVDHKNSEVVALKKELDFHKSVYSQYVLYNELRIESKDWKCC
jgi:hypothetical protein